MKYPYLTDPNLVINWDFKTFKTFQKSYYTSDINAKNSLKSFD